MSNTANTTDLCNKKPALLCGKRGSKIYHLVCMFRSVTAYKDLFNAQYVISSSISIDEKFYEMFLLDAIIETIRLSAKKGDLRAKAQAERNLSIVLGYPKHDDNRIRPEMLTQNILIVSNDPATLNLPRIENLEEKILKWSRKNPERQTIQIIANEEE